MPKSFDVETPFGTYIVNPLNVTFARATTMRVQRHSEECNADPQHTLCPIYFANVKMTDPYTCGVEPDVEGVEVCFVNTAGHESSVAAKMTPREFKNAFDEAIQYNR